MVGIPLVQSASVTSDGGQQVKGRSRRGRERERMWNRTKGKGLDEIVGALLLPNRNNEGMFPLKGVGVMGASHSNQWNESRKHGSVGSKKGRNENVPSENIGSENIQGAGLSKMEASNLLRRLLDLS